MADKGFVIITARKPVENVTEARAIYDWIKEKLIDRQDVEINGQFSNHFDLDQS